MRQSPRQRGSAATAPSFSRRVPLPGTACCLSASQPQKVPGCRARRAGHGREAARAALATGTLRTWGGRQQSADRGRPLRLVRRPCTWLLLCTVRACMAWSAAARYCRGIAADSRLSQNWMQQPSSALPHAGIHSVLAASLRHFMYRRRQHCTSASSLYSRGGGGVTIGIEGRQHIPLHSWPLPHAMATRARGTRWQTALA